MKKILALTLLAFLVEVSLPAATVAYYKFNGTGIAAEGTPINDLVGASHGAVAGGDLVYGMDSLIGGYLTFDADGADRIAIPHTPALVFTTDQAYTIEAIFRTTQFGSATLGAILSKGCDSSNPDSQYWIRRQDSGVIRGLIEGTDNTTEDNATSSNAANDGAWHHMAFVFDGTVSPKRLQIYIDGVLRGSDLSVGTLGVVGGADADPLVIGEFGTLAASRSFAGDIAALRFSDAALAPQDFLQVAATYISDITPTNGASFLPAGTVASFHVKSPTIGVLSSNIRVLVNGADVTSQLNISGNQSDWLVSLPASPANRLYKVEILATDLAGNKISGVTSFDTFGSGLLFIEGEDYNFDNGQFIDNPQLSSAPGPQNYLDRLGIEAVDYHQTNTPPDTLYRIGDKVGTRLSQDVLRQAYIIAQGADPGVADYVAMDFGNTEWLNYTRTFPANTYRVYARVARGGTAPILLGLDEVTSGSTTPNQNLASIGSFQGLPTGSANDYAFIPLVDALGNEATVYLSGIKTVRLSMISGSVGLNLNYLVFVPVDAPQAPYLAAVFPARGADNELPNLSIQAQIRNTSRMVDIASVALKLDGSAVSAMVAPSSFGAQVSYTPAALNVGLHTVTLVYKDNTAVWTTNEWQFRVANQAVRAYWKFDEKAPGNTADTAQDAILDASGNERHGTASAVPPVYVPGSIYHGSTSALRFNNGLDRVVIPDPSGSFNFSGSFTMEAVVRTTNTTAGAAILAKNGTDGEGEYWWRLPGSGGKVQQIAMNGKFVSGTNTVNDGAWHHVACVYDADTAEIRLYFDYELETTVTAVTFASPVGRPNDLTIGSFLNGGSEFNGDLDLIRISGSALVPAAFVQPSVLMEPIVIATRPAAQASVVAPNARIEAEIQNRETTVVLSSVRLFLDGNNVTGTAQATATDSGATISYGSSGMSAGTHTAKVTYQDSQSRSFTNTWSFSVTPSVTVIGDYRFNEKQPGLPADTTPGAVVDSSGNSRNGSVALPGMFYVAGSPDYGDTSALQFLYQASNYVAIADAAGAFNFGPTQSITFEAILKTTTIGESSVGSIVAKQGAGMAEYYWRIDASGKQRLAMNDGTGLKSLVGNAVLNDGQWHHLAAVYDGALKQIRLYVDYAPDGLVSVSFPSNDTVIGSAQDLWIGQFQNLTRQFEGDIDAIKATAAALDPSWFVQLGGPVSTVVLENVGVAGANISFGFTTQAGKSYTVQSTTTIGGSWSDEQTISGDGSRKNVSYATAGGQKFYRVRVQ